MDYKAITRALFILLAGLLYMEICLAQGIKVDAQIDTSQILIGDQVNIGVTVQYPDSMGIQFPVYGDTIIGGIEVISQKPLDTLINNSGLLSVRQELLISSFDTGAYMIPTGPFVSKMGDTAFGQKLFLSVNTMEIDTTKGPADIKLPYAAPFTFEEALPYIWIVLAVWVVLAIGVYVYLVIKKKKEANRPKIIIPTDPPHIIAYRELDRLKEQKLWQQEKYKLYYSRLTDILRQYIEHKFQKPALELTSGEIISMFERKQLVPSESFLLMKEVLGTADLAKFAKAQPLPEENERNFNNVFEFVSKTKLIGTSLETKEPSERTETDNA